jgi:hypothetical protein
MPCKQQRASQFFQPPLPFLLATLAAANRQAASSSPQPQHKRRVRRQILFFLTCAWYMA